MVALAAYFDESKATEGYFAMAGYVAPVQVWDESFAPDWWRVLKDIDPSLPEFKSSDCRGGYGHFARLSRAKRTLLTKQLVSVITDPLRGASGLIGIGVGMAFPPTGIAMEPVWYSHCLRQVVELVLMNVIGDEGDTLQFIFDERDDLEYKAKEGFRDAVEGPIPHRKFFGAVRNPHFAPSKDLAPLQAADLLAYETYKEIRHREESSGREVSIALRRLVAGRPHFAEYVSRQQTTDLVAQAILLERGYESEDLREIPPPKIVYRSDIDTNEIRPLQKGWIASLVSRLFRVGRRPRDEGQR
jgi:hypothetical protein